MSELGIGYQIGVLDYHDLREKDMLHSIIMALGQPMSRTTDL